ncbi:hypothetical protein HPB51_025474 [Rhipicephalus microplus]|uniref:Uncharacterized protein n=1 Tax=Rhipicephalus microplus TaxID=6941 RepID=A0A9J6DR26_RHIMP|nr:hypothetical protein HPB51_025474 [Rhipicephalus microplus]
MLFTKDAYPYSRGRERKRSADPRQKVTPLLGPLGTQRCVAHAWSAPKRFAWRAFPLPMNEPPRVQDAQLCCLAADDSIARSLLDGEESSEGRRRVHDFIAVSYRRRALPRRLLNRLRTPLRRGFVSPTRENSSCTRCLPSVGARSPRQRANLARQPRDKSDRNNERRSSFFLSGLPQRDNHVPSRRSGLVPAE